MRTGPGGSVHVLIGERGAVLLRENSAFLLQGNTRNTTLRFTFGEFLIGLRRKLEAGESFKVRTPSAVAAVRGTLFWGKTDEKKTSTYAGFGHTIAVTAKGRTVLVHAGETTTIALGEAPAEVKPSAIPLSYTDNFRIDGSLQDLESLVDLPKAADGRPASQGVQTIVTRNSDAPRLDLAASRKVNSFSTGRRPEGGDKSRPGKGPAGAYFSMERKNSCPMESSPR